ncbi:MAG: hypothetical protein DLM60_00615 [Pseudonocardiales bacterium]|nr:MAG: hypothetical protein DLM60_00615 [Pseudonocardiales bacterium]
MSRISIYLLLILASAVALFFVHDPVVVGLLTGVSTGLLIPIIDLWATHPYPWNVYIHTVRLRNSDVRISASYLIRIEVDGRYLLIRGSRYPDQFQPVGGVYKFNPSAIEKFRSWNLQSDNFIPIDKVSEDDLRVRVKGRYLLSFLKWFDSGRNREQGAFREFYEELIVSGGLPLSILTDLRFDFRRRHINEIRYSDYAQSYELLIADIFDAVCSDSRGDQLRSATSYDTSKYVWVDGDRIRRLGAVPGQAPTISIARTATWLL